MSNESLPRTMLGAIIAIALILALAAYVVDHIINGMITIDVHLLQSGALPL